MSLLCKTDSPMFQARGLSYEMCHKNKHHIMITETRSYATEVELLLLWTFPTESFYTTSYLIFSRLLSTDSSRTS